MDPIPSCLQLITRASLVTEKIHGNNNSDSEELSDVCDWEPVEDEYSYRHAHVWERLIVGCVALKRLKGYWSELGNYLKHVKARLNCLK